MLELPLALEKPASKPTSRAATPDEAERSRTGADNQDFATEYAEGAAELAGEPNTEDVDTPAEPAAKAKPNGDAIESDTTDAQVDAFVDVAEEKGLPEEGDETAPQAVVTSPSASQNRMDSSLPDTQNSSIDIDAPLLVDARKSEAQNQSTISNDQRPVVGTKPKDPGAQGLKIAATAKEVVQVPEQAQRSQVRNTAENVIATQSARQDGQGQQQNTPPPQLVSITQPVRPASEVISMVPGDAEAEAKLSKNILADIAERPVQAAAQAPSATALQQSAAVSAVQANFANLLLKADAKSERLEVLQPVTLDADTPSVFEPRSTTSTPASNLTAVLSRAETPGMIARQLAEALQNRPGGTVDVSLNPRELGKVRMSISAAEVGITVTVLAERPETLDLMRRNIDELAREFHDIGYQNINFAFSEGHAQEQQGDGFDEHGADQNHVFIDPEPDHSAAQTPPQAIVQTGLDIRL